MENQQSLRLRFSFRNATIIVCFFNLVTVLLLLQGFLSAASNRKLGRNQSDAVNVYSLLRKVGDSLLFIFDDMKIFLISSFCKTLWSVFPVIPFWHLVHCIVASVESLDYRCQALSIALPVANLDEGLQHRYIKESEEMRRAMQPLELIKRVIQLVQVREIEQEAHSEPETVQQKETKQTAALDLSKRLKDFRSVTDANNLKGDTCAGGDCMVDGACGREAGGDIHRAFEGAKEEEASGVAAASGAAPIRGGMTSDLVEML
ncbi:hypothetical protein HHK36_020425 [Tetracentron sinense]|uniref:Uncharacterized protein n=1 Tax=Tetracentron sinense TaxID=13715 RepID=A0A835D803_TETSI|nr:hypothetical protein HHK36_020425 [Tetracentron sinense]